MRSRRSFSKGLAAVFAGVAVANPLEALAKKRKPRAISTGNWSRAGNSSSYRAPTTTKLIRDFGTSPMLTASSLKNIKAAISRYEKIVAKGGWGKLPKSRVLVRGAKGKIVASLIKRLAAEGYMELPDNPKSMLVFGEKTEKALKQYQKANGLHANGKLNKETRKALNISASARLATLKANLPRVAEAVKGLPDRYIVVNIPATQLDAVEFGILHSRHNVVVGKASRPSPILKSRVTQLNFNPYWNAPVSIVKKDIIPKLRKSLNILKTMNIKIYDGYGGPEVDPKKVDWSKADPEKYHFRQEPGEGNAMASVKINFANKYAVYMHDTPTKRLFSQASRYFSSGCVRVDKVHILTDWILKKTSGWDRNKIEAVVKSGEREDVKVKNGPQVQFVYFTAWATDDGLVHFRNDIYKLDGTGFVSGQPKALDS